MTTAVSFLARRSAVVGQARLRAERVPFARGTRGGDGTVAARAFLAVGWAGGRGRRWGWCLGTVVPPGHSDSFLYRVKDVRPETEEVQRWGRGVFPFKL